MRAIPHDDDLAGKGRVGDSLRHPRLDFGRTNASRAAPIAGVEQPQGDFTLFGLRMMMSLIPAGFLVCAAACLALYDIGEPLLRQIEADLAERRRAAAAS